MDVKEVLLPGVGLRYEFTDHKGDRIGIIARRSGDFEVVVYAREDPDEARPLLHLSDEEAEAVAQILGAPRSPSGSPSWPGKYPDSRRGKFTSWPIAPSWAAPWVTPTPAPAPAPPSSRSCVTRKCSPRPGRPKCYMPETF